MKSSIIIIIVGVVIIALAAWAASFSFKFLATASHAEGKVVDMEQTDGGLWYPVIEFMTKDGKTMTVRPESASNPSPYKKGQILDMLYSPDNPQDWRINRFVDMWLLPVILASVGAIVAVAGVGFLLVENGSMPALGSKVFLLLGVAVFGLVGLLMLWGAWYVAGNTRQFMQNAVPATGTILELKARTSKDSKGRRTTSYYPTIEFVTQGGEKVKYISSQSIDRYKYSVGESIKMLYDRSDPQNAKMDSFADLWGTSIVLGVMGVAFVGGALLVYLILYRQMEVGALFIAGGFAFAVVLLYAGAWWLSQDSRYLMQHGVRTTGTVVGFALAPVVEFQTKDGKTIKHQSSVSSKPPTYSDGDSVKILYDPHDPHRATIDSFEEMWLFPAIMAGMGTVFLLACIFAIYIGVRYGE